MLIARAVEDVQRLLMIGRSRSKFMKCFISVMLLLLLIGAGTKEIIAKTWLVERPNAVTQSSTDPVEVDRLTAQVIELYREGKFDEALPLAKRALEISEALFGVDNAHVASAAINLAELYIAKRKFKEAEPLLQRAIQINDKLLKANDPTLVKTLERYTCLLKASNESDKLKDFEKKRVATLETSAESDRFWGALWGRTKAITMPRPDYPEAAKRAGASGTILIKVSLDEEGKVVKAESMCGGNPLLAKAAEAAALQARFTPVLVKGAAIRIVGYVPYVFVR
jgi:TonB family protein